MKSKKKPTSFFKMTVKKGSKQTKLTETVNYDKPVLLNVTDRKYIAKFFNNEINKLNENLHKKDRYHLVKIEREFKLDTPKGIISKYYKI